MKLNLILFVILIICALTTINFKHLTRNNFAELDEQSKRTLDLKDQQTMLRIEESSASRIEIIEKTAKHKLNMHIPNTKEKKVIFR
jgi:cell division protein FtsL|tara:strand:- start:243 stop:500 length:258 start_codon:yes stop_codon:yes gene_type:complete